MLLQDAETIQLIVGSVTLLAFLIIFVFVRPYASIWRNFLAAGVMLIGCYTYVVKVCVVHRLGK